MLAFITGASSGIGKDMAKILAQKGYDLILTARDEEKLLELKNEILGNEKTKKIEEINEAKKEKYVNKQEKNTLNLKDKDISKISIKIIIANLENEEEVFALYEKVKNENIDIFINNAGFGTAGEFWKTDLKTEINMLKVNDLAMHILFKLILKDMLKTEGKEKHILNVASLAGFMPGPRMSAYYATKAYMLNLTRGVYKELKMIKSKVNLSVLCPGPIYTNFVDRAGVNFKTKFLTSEYTAKYAIKKMFKKKLVIIPGILNKCEHVLVKILPSKLVMIVTYRIQERAKNKSKE